MPIPAFSVLCVLVAGFIVVTGQGLPELVGSHFVAGGSANAFMPRSHYLGVMLGAGVGVPALIVALSRMPGFLQRSWQPADADGNSRLHAWLARQATVFASILMVFLAFVHWLVVLANRAAPPLLPEPAMVAGLVVFGVVELVWVIRLVAGLRRAQSRAGGGFRR